jgi:hypothetical protein
MTSDPATTTAPPANRWRWPRRASGGTGWRWLRPRVVRTVLLVLACVFTALCVLVLFSCWRDDVSINQHLGRTDADVLAVSFNRTAVRFVTPSGTVELPPNGVLYPGGLVAGDRVVVEYDQADPELVRVAGRSYRLAFLPVGLAVGITWGVVGPLLWWLGRRGRRSAVPPAEDLVGDAGSGDDQPVGR